MGTKTLLTNTANKLFLTCRNTSSVFFTRKASLWTSDNIVKSPHKDVDIPSRTVPEHIWENLDRWADKTAIICGVTERSYNYHQLYKYSRNFGTKLRTQLKIRDGDVVCVMIPNSPEYPLISLGALEAGAVVSTINPMYTPHEVERQITLSGAKVLIGYPETIPILREALFLAKKDLPIITVKGSNGNIPAGTICFEELAIADNVDQSILKYINKTSEEVAFLPYSSGTTGLPKGVELTHRNIVVNCLQQDVDTIRHYNETTIKHQDTTLAIMPFYHIYGLSIVLLHKLSMGSKLVSVPKFHTSTFINILEEHPTNIMYMAPALILFLGSHSGVTDKHLVTVKTITSGGALLPLKDISKLLEKVKPGTDLLNLYGMTEASPLVTIMLPGGNNYDTVGFALPNSKLRIVNSNQELLGPNEVGELQIFGPHVMKGYRNNVQATKDTITEDGWLKSGDLASIDRNGAVTIADRLKELIKVKGFQVPPAELENILKDHPNVFDVAVVGIPHERKGEIPKAFIVLKEGQQVSAEEIMSFVDHKVVEYKRVKEVQFVDEIPRNPSGKILRRVMKERYC